MSIFSMPKPNNSTQYKPKEKKHNWDKSFEEESYSKLRSTSRWQRLRYKMLSLFPLCWFCGHSADQVHHIISNDESLFFDEDNLVTICEECHGRVNSAYRRGITTDILFQSRKD